MALGGGTFLVENKILPGSYMNFVSVAHASATLSDRGIATMPVNLDWGADGVTKITNEQFQTDSQKLLGYAYTSPKLKGFRELFANITTAYLYRLNGGGVKASNDFATAKYSGTRGNDLKIVISKNVDKTDTWDVATYLDTARVDLQEAVANAAALEDNDYVVWKDSAVLVETTIASEKSPLAGGTNTASTGNEYSEYLKTIENYNFNAMGAVVTDDITKSLFVSNVKRMRDQVGKKFQLILYDAKSPDYEGVINVKNPVDTSTGDSEASLVWWVTGISAGCEVNKSNLNKVYDGEFTVKADYDQDTLKEFIQDGYFALHQVDDDIRVLEDINSFVSVTDTKGDVFKDNQTIRICDQIGNDIATLFNTRYLGKVPNDKSGRLTFWKDLVKYHEQLQDIRCIENFDPKSITVEQGDSKKNVKVTDYITVINTMEKLYMTVWVA